MSTNSLVITHTHYKTSAISLPQFPFLNKAALSINLKTTSNKKTSQSKNFEANLYVPCKLGEIHSGNLGKIFDVLPQISFGVNCVLNEG